MRREDRPSSSNCATSCAPRRTRPPTRRSGSCGIAPGLCGDLQERARTQPRRSGEPRSRRSRRVQSRTRSFRRAPPGRRNVRRVPGGDRARRLRIRPVAARRSVRGGGVNVVSLPRRQGQGVVASSRSPASSRARSPRAGGRPACSTPTSSTRPIPSRARARTRWRTAASSTSPSRGRRKRCIVTTSPGPYPARRAQPVHRGADRRDPRGRDRGPICRR